MNDMNGTLQTASAKKRPSSSPCLESGFQYTGCIVFGGSRLSDLVRELETSGARKGRQLTQAGSAVGSRGVFHRFPVQGIGGFPPR